MALQLIVNADDFGYSGGMNSAVKQAYEFGTLSSASLMVTGEAVPDAVDVAKDCPGLAVGLHLALSRARPVLSPEQIPALVEPDGRFADDPARAGLRYFFSGEARKQLAREIEAQFEAFIETGLKLSHVDGHQHLHAHPAVMPVVVRLAEEYGAVGVRVPREPRFLRTMLASCYSPALLMGVLGQAFLAWTANRLLSGSRLIRCDYCIGGFMSGRLTDEYVMRAIESVGEGRVELYSHPSTEPSVEPMGPNVGDFAALMSPRLRSFIGEQCELATYELMAKREAVR